MYTHESGKRVEDPAARAHDHLAAGAVRASSPEDVAAAVRVLSAMADETLLVSLQAEMTTDADGNPTTDTPDQQLAQATWARAFDLTGRLREIASALRHASSTTRGSGE